MANTNVRNSLKDYKLEFEEMETRKVPRIQSKVHVSKTKPDAKVVKTDAIKRKESNSFVTRFKTSMRNRAALSRSGFNDLKSRLTPEKKTYVLHKKARVSSKNSYLEQQKRGILGLGLLFVVVSIAYSSYVIYNGVHSTASRIMLIPQVVFAVYTLVKAFSKIYK